ncbi:MAG TPA: GspH/FimT family pseudopilin [Ramlibacter sp.]
MLIRRLQRGFNLVEAIVAISILGLLVAAAVPSMADWVRSSQVRNLAETTQAGLQKARMEAMKRNRTVGFWLVGPAATAPLTDSCVLASNSGAWVVSLENPAGKCATAVSDTVSPRIVETYAPGTASNGLTVSALTATGTTAATSVTFNGYGQIQATVNPLARIDISHASDTGARKLRVEVSANGAIRMCDRNVVAPDPRACNLAASP